MKIRGDERVLLVGKTGSGKTYAAKRILSAYPRVIYFDPLYRLDMEVSSLSEMRRTLKREETYQICTQDFDDFTSIVQENFEEGGFVIYIDELYAVCETPNSVPEVINQLWTRGRGNNIGAWAATQRPTRIPRVCLSECEHYLIFRLQISDDRKVISKNIDDRADALIKDEHGFYYVQPSSDVFVQYKKLGVIKNGA